MTNLVTSLGSPLTAASGALLTSSITASYVRVSGSVGWIGVDPGCAPRSAISSLVV
jgi:hypothetical protein